MKPCDEKLEGANCQSKFEKWRDKERGGEMLAEGNLAKDAWNAAIDAAEVAAESADCEDSDAGNGAICNAMMQICRLKAK